MPAAALTPAYRLGFVLLSREIHAMADAGIRVAGSDLCFMTVSRRLFLTLFIALAGVLLVGGYGRVVWTLSAVKPLSN